MKLIFLTILSILFGLSAFGGTTTCPKLTALDTRKMPKVGGLKKYSQPLRLEMIDEMKNSNGTFEYVCYYEGKNRRKPTVNWIPLYGTGKQNGPCSVTGKNINCTSKTFACPGNITFAKGVVSDVAGLTNMTKTQNLAAGFNSADCHISKGKHKCNCNYDIPASLYTTGSINSKCNIKGNKINCP